MVRCLLVQEVWASVYPRPLFSSFWWLRVAQVATQVLREILDIRNRSMLGVLRCLGPSWTTLLRDAEPAPVHREWLILQSSQESENLMLPGGF